jgi:MFS superfamily sulfate permease-like transporter
MLKIFFPFLRWFPMTRETLRADLVAGITIALILVPQSMAYAQLAGLPVVYGLYASFIPVIVASLWGSSNQLHTGPVAMLSLMSAAAVISYATPGTTDFIEISLMLAMLVGVLRLALGIFRMGAIINLLSSPVIIGFTNAAAIIIGFSQLSKIIGVPFPRSDSYINDLWNVVTQVSEVHLWTFMFAIGSWVLIAGLRKISPTIPGVLFAVVITTIIAAATGYEDKMVFEESQIKDEQIKQVITDYTESLVRINELTTSIANSMQEVEILQASDNIKDIEDAETLHAHANVEKYQVDKLKIANSRRQIELHHMHQKAIKQDGEIYLVSEDTVGAQSHDDKTWRFHHAEDGKVIFSAGGAVIGNIPQGLPSFKVPDFRWDLLLALLPSAIVMALIGFMEATSISKAIATVTGEKVDTSKELIGQGLANITGSFFGSYTVSGSFSRSAVAARTGAKTGLFAIISALSVVLVLLFFTDYLYHLPQAVLAVIVMMAVLSLIRIKPLLHWWKIDRVDSVIGFITFAATLLMAPAIANGILLGIGLTILAFLVTTMKPRVEIISRKKDGTFGGIDSNKLAPLSEMFVPVRFDGALTFINVAYFEDMVLNAHAKFPKAKTILIIGSGINSLDVSGEEKIREVAESLNKVGVKLAFSSLKYQVVRVMIQAGLIDIIGKENFFSSKEVALESLCRQAQVDSGKIDSDCSHLFERR